MLVDVFLLIVFPETLRSAALCVVQSHRAAEFHNLWRMKVGQIQYREKLRQTLTDMLAVLLQPLSLGIECNR